MNSKIIEKPIKRFAAAGCVNIIIIFLLHNTDRTVMLMQ